MTYANGSRYIGQWLNDLYSGEGTFYGAYEFANSDVYEGSWKFGKKDGIGT